MTNTNMTTTTTTTMTNNTGLSIDLRLLATRKSLELAGLNKDVYAERFKIITIEKKYSIVIEALEGLYGLGIQHSCSLVELINQFDSI